MGLVEETGVIDFKGVIIGRFICIVDGYLEKFGLNCVWFFILLLIVCWGINTLDYKKEFWLLILLWLLW